MIPHRLPGGAAGGIVPVRVMVDFLRNRPKLHTSAISFLEAP
jgi:hypothetical protein